MNEESIFTEALSKRSPAERATYLDEACAGNATLRRQVEELLCSHAEQGSFLERPALDQVIAEERGPLELTESAGTSPPFEPTVAHRPILDRFGETRANTPDSELEDDLRLDFLASSGEPGSLGRLGHYEVNEVVGRGGMAVVLRAFDTKLYRVVAIKVMAGELAASATARRRFSREAQAAAAVCHEHVVTIHAVDEDHRPPYLVMQFVDGLSLQEKLDQGGPLKLREILRIGLQTADGLAAAHKQGLVHRDIKPANILLENGVERVKITDFGLARAADDASLTQSGVIAGTPQYMSPEQAEGAAVDHRSDLFSLGSVLYAACTGRAPFRAASAMAVLKRVVEDTPRPIREIKSDIPDWLCDLIARLQAKDPVLRPGSAAEVALVLSRRLAELQQPMHLLASSEMQLEARPASSPSPRHPVTPDLHSPPRPTARHLVASSALMLVLLGTGLSEATGVTHVTGTVIRLFRPEGTLVIEADDPAVSVSVDGNVVVVSGAGIRELRLRPGTHEVKTRRGDVELGHKIVEIERGGRRIVRVDSTKAPQPAVTAAPGSTAPASPPDDWYRMVFHLPVEKQANAVAARLKELNPGFDGKLEATIVDGYVRKLKLCSDSVADITPVRALRELWDLKAEGSAKGRGRLFNIEPLRDLRMLECLGLGENDITDLAPLNGLPLSYLGLGHNPIRDLEPLRGMHLSVLHIWNTHVEDLSPLIGMPLKDLNATATPVNDLSPLKGMPLDLLVIGFSHVGDLSPVKGLPLTVLDIDGTKIQDLDPIRGARLQEFHYPGTPIRDVSVLRGMPLKDVICDFQPAREAAVLRSITTLKSINRKPAAEFWKEFDARPEAAQPR